MKAGMLVIRGKSNDVTKQLKEMKPEDFEALKRQVLTRKGLQ